MSGPAALVDRCPPAQPPGKGHRVMRRITVATCLLASFLLAGCAEYGPKEAAGGLLGAGSGAYIGSLAGMGTGNLAAIGGGALLGALVGSNVGRSLDRADRLATRPTRGTAGAVAPGSGADWRNPDAAYATVAPLRSPDAARRGAYCREFQQTIQIGGEDRQAHGTACQQPDGSWRIAG